jgi:autotransporter-associated beta strand protein
LGTNRTISLGATGGYLQAGWGAQGQGLIVNGRITWIGGLGINWDSGSVILNAVNNYQGDTTIGTAGPSYLNDGNANPTLKLGIDNALPNGAGAGNVVFGTSANNNTATLDLNGHSARINGLTGGSNATIDNTSGTGTYALTVGDNNQSGIFGGVIKNTTGAVAVTKTGTGTLTLSGTSTYTGATRVSLGTLLVNGALGDTATTVSSGTAILGGGGSIAGDVTVAGTIAPGAPSSIGTLTTGALALQNNSTLSYSINTASLGGDAVKANGNLTIDTGAVLSFDLATAGTLATGDKLTLIAYSGTWNSGEFSGYTNNSTFTITGDNTANTWKINYADTAGGSNLSGLGGGFSYATITVVPEPRAALLGGLGMLLLLRRRRLTA